MKPPPGIRRYILLTGFTGLLGSVLVRTLLRQISAFVVVLVRRSSLDRAGAEAAAVLKEMPFARGRLEVVVGDITDASLAMEGDNYRNLAGLVQEVFHLAAVTALDTKKKVAKAVNVDGTENVIRFAAACGQLRRLHYISDIRIAGNYRGSFGEKDLELGQRYRNAVERSKFLAERLVHAYNSTMPITVYRLAPLVGDSATGKIARFDGFYHLLRFARETKLPGPPRLGQGFYRLQFVPVDYAAQCVAYLSLLDHGRGHTYQIADTHPPFLDEIVEQAVLKMRRHPPRGRAPLGLLRFLAWIPGMAQVVRLPSRFVPYLRPTAHFASSETEDALAYSGISCPRFSSYFNIIVDYMLQTYYGEKVEHRASFRPSDAGIRGGFEQKLAPPPPPVEPQRPPPGNPET